MTINSLFAIAMLLFIAVLAVSTVMVSIALFKEIKKLKNEAVPSLEKEAEEN